MECTYSNQYISIDNNVCHFSFYRFQPVKYEKKSLFPYISTGTKGKPVWNNCVPVPYDMKNQLHCNAFSKASEIQHAKNTCIHRVIELHAL